MNRLINKIRIFKLKLMIFLNNVDSNGIGIVDAVDDLIERSRFISTGPLGILIYMVAMVVDFILSLVCLLGALSLLIVLLFVDTKKGYDDEVL